MSTNLDLSSKRLSLATLIVISLLFTKNVLANDYIKSAEEYLANQEKNAAVIELKNAIRKAPEDGYARFLLGKVFFEQGDFSSAEQQLLRALKHGYEKEAVSILVARAMLNQRKIEDAFLFINEQYPNREKTPVDLLALSAIAEINLKNIDSATRLLEKTSEKTVYTELARTLILFAERKNENALVKIKDLINTNNQNSDLWLLKGHIETSLNEVDSAYKSYVKAYDLAPKAYIYTFYIARTLVQLQRFTDALPYIDNLLSVNKNNTFVNELKAISVFANKNYTDAKLHADLAINNGLSNLRLLSISGISAFYLNKIEDSYNIFNKIDNKLPKNHPIKRLHIITQFKLGYIDDAIKNLNEYPVESVNDSQFLSQVSVELTKIGRNDLALKLAEKASPKAEGETETILNFIKLANNDTSGIDDLLASVEKEPSSIKIKQGLANYYLTKGMFDKADEVANDWLKNQPNDIVALAIKGLINKSQGKTKIAKSYFNKVRELDSKNLQAIIELAKIESIEDNKNQALALFKEAKYIAPGNHKVSDIFLKYHRENNSLNDALTIIDDQIKQEPLNSQLKIQKASALVMSGDSNAAIMILESLPNKNKRVWTSLISIYAAQNDNINLKKSYQEWLKIDQYNPTAYLLNINYLLEQDAMIDAMQIINQAKKTFPNDLRFSLAKTETLLKQGKIKLATEEFSSISVSEQENLEYLRIQGMLHLTNSNFAEALNVYQKRFDLQPNSKLALELASIYLLNKQKDRAINFLDELVTKFKGSKNNQFLQLKLMLAELSMDSNANKSIELYSDIVSLQPKNVVALNNLSWLLFEQNQIAKACSIAQKAHDLANQSANIADTYGYCLLKNGETNKALNLLEFAYNDKKEDPMIALHFAEALIEAKQITKAVRVLSNISTTAPDIIAAKNTLEKTVVSLTQ